ncbi:MAG: acetyltransferase, partial [Corynebacterium variabile]|nr:acetyltransferase [Corynebacterium variabile]
ERWAEDWRAKLATTYSVPLILSLRGEDIGYMEIYRPHRDEIGAVYASEPHDLGLHIAVGDPELVGQGIVGPMLGALPPALLDADPECRVVVGEPDHRNGRVHAVLRREGWIDRGERQQRPDRRVRLFLYGEDAATR